jgi:transposase-like protein
MQKTATELARALGISRQTFYAWRRVEGFPEGAEAQEIADWAASRGLNKQVNKADGNNLAELKAEALRRDITLKDLKISAQRGDLVEREVVRSMLRLLSQKLDLLLRLKLEVELGPRVVGKSAAEANVEGSRILDEIREVIAGNIARFETEAVKATTAPEDAE